VNATIFSNVVLRYRGAERDVDRVLCVPARSPLWPPPPSQSGCMHCGPACSVCGSRLLEPKLSLPTGVFFLEVLRTLVSFFFFPLRTLPSGPWPSIFISLCTLDILFSAQDLRPPRLAVSSVTIRFHTSTHRPATSTPLFDITSLSRLDSSPRTIFHFKHSFTRSSTQEHWILNNFWSHLSIPGSAA
jgi:hypothetical protein